eukprot:2162370-Amphidinium_carterae.1
MAWMKQHDYEQRSGLYTPNSVVQRQKLLGRSAGRCAIMKSRETVLEKIKWIGYALENADEVWKNDHEVVLAAVRQNGDALQYASEALKGNREIVLAAVQETGDALRYATEALKRDRDVVLTA